MCNEGEWLCRDQSLYRCAEDGIELRLVAECAAEEICDASSGTCRATCEPGQLGCVGYCLPNTLYCLEGNVFRCASSGLSSELYFQCGDKSRCVEYAEHSQGYCIANRCEPGERLCWGQDIVTCTEEGDIPPIGNSPDDVQCGSNQYCLDAACHDRECEPGSRMCRDADVFQCDNLGRAVSYEECVAPMGCTQLNGDAICVRRTCDPGVKSCVQNRIGTCADDATGLTGASQDCTATGQVCDGSLSCLDRVVELLGGKDDSHELNDGALVGNVIDVHSDRRLLELQIYLTLATTGDLHWLVYEQTGELGFQQLFEQLTTAQSGSGFFSSGALDVTLEAGRHYLLAVEITGTEATGYTALAPATPGPSFGHSRADIQGSRLGAGLNDHSYRVEQLEAMRLTTELP